MKRNLTLAIDEDLLLQARKFALERNTTVNRIIRDYLARIVNEENRRQAARERMDRYMREKRIEIGKRRWKREDLYER